MVALPDVADMQAEQIGPAQLAVEGEIEHRGLAEGHPPVTGVLTRYNRKTVTVIADTGQQWNVAPQLLRRVAPPATESAQAPNVIPMPRRPR
jgi:hypothetical protein